MLSATACIQPRMSASDCIANAIQQKGDSRAAWSVTPVGGRIEGQVRDVDGGPIGNVEVQLAYPVRSRRTDGQGAFRFDSLSSGAYRLITQGTGYESRVDSVQLTPAHGVKADIRLRVQQAASRACQAKLPEPRR